MLTAFGDTKVEIRITKLPPFDFHLKLPSLVQCFENKYVLNAYFFNTILLKIVKYLVQIKLSVKPTCDRDGWCNTVIQ